LQRQRLRDLDELHLGNAESIDRRPRVGPDVERLQPVLCLGDHLGAIDQPGSGGGRPFQSDVFRYAEARDQITFLVHRADTGLDRVSG
jgi:hypothetical protein